MTLTIRKRFTLALIIGGSLIAFTTATSLYQFTQMARSAAAVESASAELITVFKLQIAVDMVLMPAFEYFITGQKTKEDPIPLPSKEAEQMIQRLGGFPNLTEEERDLLPLIQVRFERLKGLASEILTLSTPIDTTRRAILMEQLYTVSQSFIFLLNQYHVLNIHEIEKYQKESVRARQKVYGLLAITGVALGTFILVYGLRLTRSFIHPIRMLETGTERIAAGAWDYRVDIRTGDELETLARRFNGMAEKLGNLYRSLEEQVAERTYQMTERLDDLATLLESSTELSATLDMDRLLPQIAERLTRTTKTTYCRIALFEEDRPDPVIRAAYPIRMLDWEPMIGRTLICDHYPALCATLKKLRYSILSKETIHSPEWTTEREHLLTPATHSALILPLIWEGRLKGLIILGEARHWKRESFSEEKISLGQTMANQAVVAITNSRHHASLQEMFLETVSTMTTAIDAKSPWTRGHSDRVTRHAMTLGARLGLEAAALNDLRLGCLLHDIGKIGTIEAILEKPDRLTQEEITVMQLHPTKGEEILRPIRYFKSILPIIRHHHERYDGTGYPDGLAGDDIPLLARVTTVADAYDSMTADRPYRQAPGWEKATAEIRRCSGTQFDPSIAKVFISMLEQGYR